jgi:hypothetical protein
MNRIGKLPAISIKTALHVFRCRGCKAIKTVSLDATMLRCHTVASRRPPVAPFDRAAVSLLCPAIFPWARLAAGVLGAVILASAGYFEAA